MISMITKRYGSNNVSITRLQNSKSESNETKFHISFLKNVRDNKPDMQSITFSDFIELCKNPIIRRTKDGKAFVPATFSKNRSNESVEKVSMLVLDYDHNADFDSDLEVWKKLGISFIAYTTHSHRRKTNSNPKVEQRFRVVIPLKTPISSNLHPSLWKYAYQVTKGKIDVGAKAVSQPQYLPAKVSDDAEYKFDFAEGDLLDWESLSLVETKEELNVKKAQEISVNFVLRENAEPPTNKLDMLLEIDDEFRSAWQKRISKFNDDASRYDLCLANRAIDAGFSDQETVDLLVAFRRRHNLTPKSQKNNNPVGYYATTLLKARTEKSVVEHSYLPDYKSLKADVDTEIDDANTDNEFIRLKAIKFLAGRFNLPNLTGVVQYGLSQSSYSLERKDGEPINLGSANELQQQSKVRAQLFDANAIMPKYSNNEWNEILKNIRLVVRLKDTGSDAEEMLDYIKTYFNINQANVGVFGLDPIRMGYIDFTNDDKYEVFEELRKNSLTGFIDARTGAVFLPLGRFLERLNFFSGRRWTPRELKHYLSRLGFGQEQKSVRYKDKQGVSRTFNAGRFWTSPSGYLPIVR